MSRKISIPLHIQILLGLVLGTVFGIIFNVDHNKLNVTYLDEKSRSADIVISDWDSLTIISKSDNQFVDSTVYSFGKDDFSMIIRKSKELINPQNNSINIIYKIGEKENYLGGVIRIAKVQTIATNIKPIGTLFINLLSFIAIPLVISSLIVGASSLDDIKKLGRIGGKTFVIYLSTTAIAIIIGLTMANLIQPGNKVDSDTKDKLIAEFQSDTPVDISQHLEIDILDFIVSIVPKNPINAMANGAMLQIVFFAVIFGVTALFIDKEKSGIVLGFFSGVSEIMIKMVHIIMKIAPIGVFALISATIADFGYGILTTLFWYIIAVVLGLALHTFGVYGILVKFIGKYKFTRFFKALRNAHTISFSTSSSAATLPVTFDCVENNIGVPKQVTGFVLPLGATINMDGTALYQGVAAVFIAQVYGFDLTIADQLTIVLTATLASIGTAPVPGVGIIMLVMILESIHIPPQGIALIIGVDRLLDMCRTITNVTGDAAVCVAVARSEGFEIKPPEIK